MRLNNITDLEVRLCPVCYTTFKITEYTSGRQDICKPCRYEEKIRKSKEDENRNKE